MKDIINQFYNEGYIGPFKLLDNDECNNILMRGVYLLKSILGINLYMKNHHWLEKFH